MITTTIPAQPNVNIGDTITHEDQSYKAVKFHSSGKFLKSQGQDCIIMFTPKGALELEKV